MEQSLKLTIDLINAIIIGNIIGIALGGLCLLLSKISFKIIGTILLLISIIIIPAATMHWANNSSSELAEYYLSKGQYIVMAIVFVIGLILMYIPYRAAKKEQDF